jgi:hypothetical protein
MVRVPFPAVQTGSGAFQHSIRWVPGALSPGVKRPRREADHSPPSSAEVTTTSPSCEEFNLLGRNDV